MKERGGMSATAMDIRIPPGIDRGFAADVLAGLARPQKELPCRWFYDERGSELFQRITQLPEYYPTQTEAGILTSRAREIAGIVGPGAALIEYGAGAAVKTRILLDALETPSHYAPIDISAEYLKAAVRDLAKAYPGIAMTPVVGNFLSDVAIPPELQQAHRRLGFFPGSTIGNLGNEDITGFFSRARRQLGDNGMLLIGADLRKSPDILIPAYDDSAGVTAAFNRNLLVRINRELGGDFDLARFSHRAVWNDAGSRIEMHLVSGSAQRVTILGRAFDFAPGESIHTENSRKFEIAALQTQAARCGWRARESWTDEDQLFAVLLFG
jgi:dimethylhistidine N-methyltransferase